MGQQQSQPSVENGHPAADQEQSPTPSTAELTTSPTSSTYTISHPVSPEPPQPSPGATSGIIPLSQSTNQFKASKSDTQLAKPKKLPKAPQQITVRITDAGPLLDKLQDVENRLQGRGKILSDCISVVQPDKDMQVGMPRPMDLELNRLVRVAGALAKEIIECQRLYASSSSSAPNLDIEQEVFCTTIEDLMAKVEEWLGRCEEAVLKHIASGREYSKGRRQVELLLYKQRSLRLHLISVSAQLSLMEGMLKSQRAGQRR